MKQLGKNGNGARWMDRARMKPVSCEVSDRTFIAREITIAVDRSPPRINIYRWMRLWVWRSGHM